jgi:hypothetical protein
MGPKIGRPLLKTRVESLSLRKKADASRRQTSNKTVSPICLGFVLMGSEGSRLKIQAMDYSLESFLQRAILL